MSRWLGVTLLVLGVLVSVGVDSAMAQPGRGGQGGGRGGMMGGMMGGGGTAMMLMNPQVREQLELSEDQIQRLEDLQADMRDEMQDMFRGGGGGDAREKMQEVMGRIQKEIDGVLLKHQREQLAAMTASMTMQRGGGAGGVLNNPALIKELGLSDSEVEKLKEQAAELQAKQDEEIAKIRERYNERIIALLPKEAQEKLKEWSKTEVPEFNFGGGRGDRGGRGEQGRGQRPLDF